MANNKESKAVIIRQAKQKEVLIEELKKRPIVQSACQKIGIGRATFYRWKKEDEKFSDDVDEAMDTGAGIVNDMAESQLMSAIRDGHMTAIIFWLKHHHRAYATKVELNARIRTENGTLTPEQEEAVRKALELASLQESNHETYDNPPKPKQEDGSEGDVESS